MRRRQTKRLFGFGFVHIVFLSFLMASTASGISGQNIKFSSAYTDTTKQCKGAEPTFTCAGYGGYRIVMDIGGVFASARVESTKSDFVAHIAERQSVGWNPKVEWRMANGKPFAVIVRVDDMDKEADIPRKIGETLFVKGLRGYEYIGADVDTKVAQANEKAREIADKGYTGGANSMPVAQTDAYTDGTAALLSAANIKKLSALNAAVAIPTYIPKGYKFKKLEIQAPEAHIIAFSIIYAGAAGKTFTIESNNEALGDMAVKREVKGVSKYFKDSAQESGEFYTGHDQNDPKTVASEWLCSVEKYQPKTSIAQCFQVLSGNKRITPTEAMKIMNSLRYLKR